MINLKINLNPVRLLMPVRLCSFAFILLTPTLSVQAEQTSLQVPEGFDDVLQTKEKQVQFEDANGEFHPVTLNVNYQGVSLSDPSQAQKVKDFLIQSQVSEDMASQIVSDLKTGKLNTDACVGDIDKCLVTPDTYAILYDYYSDKVHFWINPNYLTRSYAASDTQYAPAFRPKSAFINHFDAYLSMDEDTDDNLILYDESIFGLPYGYLSTDMTYETEGGDYDLDEALYNLDIEKWRMELGYTNNTQSFNSTDFLVNTNQNGQWAVDFASSDRLLLNGTQQLQKIFFFAPQSGVLYVYRDDRIIYQTNVTQGQGFFTNADLPSGRYDVDIVLVSGGQEVSRETRPIYNTSNDTLAVNDFDFRFTAGAYGRSGGDAIDALDKDEEPEFNNPNLDPDDLNDLDGVSPGTLADNIDNNDRDVISDGFARALTSYRATDSLLLGAGLTGSSDDSYASLGAAWYLPYSALMTLTSDIFFDETYQTELNFGISNFNLTYERLDDSKNSNLARYLYNDSDFERVTASTNYRFTPSAYGYVTYTYLEQDGFNDNDFDGFRSSYINLGLNFFTVFDSTLDLNASYDFLQSNNREQLYASVVWSIPLSTNVTSRLTIQGNENDVNLYRAAVEARDLIDNPDYYSSIEVAQTHDSDLSQQNYASLTASLQANKPKFQANAYTYLDTKGDKSLNAGFSSSQIITANDIYLTSDRSDAYAAVDNQSELDLADQSQGLLVVEANGSYASRRSLTPDENIQPLKAYNQYNVSLDTSSEDLLNTGETSDSAYAHPGTVLEIRPNITRILGFVSGFRDIFDRPLNDVSCEGEGCLAASEMANGVYKVSVREAQEFELASKNAKCVIPDVNDMNMFNLGQNYCLPDLKVNTSISENVPTEQGVKAKQAIFVGGFNAQQTSAVTKQLGQFKQGQFEVKRVSFKTLDYYYLIFGKDQKLSRSQQNIIASVAQKAQATSVEIPAYQVQR